MDVDREGLTKLKKAVKAMHASGNGKDLLFTAVDQKVVVRSSLSGFYSQYPLY